MRFNMYKVAEKFISINGEGQRAGELAVFIRLLGCNLSCSYCDTQWAISPDRSHEIFDREDILRYIKSTGVKNITLTGGEPLMHPGIGHLIESICSHRDLHLEVETNGSQPIDLYKKYDNLSFTVDYKSASSMMQDQMFLDNYKHVDMKDTVKFVVGSQKDLDDAYRLIRDYDLLNKTHVYLSPIFGAIESKAIVDFMVEKKLNGARLQLQLHKYIWDPQEKGV